MIKALFAFITGRKLVWLEDFDGEITLSIAKVNPWGDLVAERYWPFPIRTIKLYKDGTASSYVDKWKYVTPQRQNH